MMRFEPSLFFCVTMIFLFETSSHSLFSDTLSQKIERKKMIPISFPSPLLPKKRRRKQRRKFPKKKSQIQFVLFRDVGKKRQSSNQLATFVIKLFAILIELEGAIIVNLKKILEFWILFSLFGGMVLPL